MMTTLSMLTKSVGGWWLAALIALGLLHVGAVRLAADSTSDLRLVDAVKIGDKTAAATLIKQRVNVNAPEADGTTALHWAVRQDDPALVDQLLRAGADVKVANRYGITALYLACVNGSAAVIELLLKAGADPNLT